MPCPCRAGPGRGSRRAGCLICFLGYPFFPLLCAFRTLQHCTSGGCRPGGLAARQALQGFGGAGLGAPHRTPSQARPGSAPPQLLGACERARTALLLPKCLGTACAPRTAPMHLRAVHAHCCGPWYGHVTGGMPVTGQGCRKHALRTLPAPALRAGRTTSPSFACQVLCTWRRR